MGMYNLSLIILSIVGLMTGVCSVILCFQHPSKEQKYVSYTIGVVILFLIGYFAYFLGEEEQILEFGIKLQLFSGFILYLMVYEIFQRVYNIRVPHAVNIVLGLWTLFFLVICVCFSNKTELGVCHWFYQNYYLATDTAGNKFLSIKPDRKSVV